MNHNIVKAGGLFYPISSVPDYEKYKGNSHINEMGIKMIFSIDGIKMVTEIETENLIRKEKEFIKRILKSLD